MDRVTLLFIRALLYDHSVCTDIILAGTLDGPLSLVRQQALTELQAPAVDPGDLHT